MKKLLVVLAALLAFAAPAQAQMSAFGSEGEQFLEDVRKFDAAKAMGALRRPGNNLIDYRGRDGGTQDPEEFAKLVEGQTEVKIVDWYATPA